MPARTFAITADDKPITLDANGAGEISVTVANTAAKPIRGLAKLMPLGSTKAGWLSIKGEAERSFSAGETHQFLACIQAPDSPSGKYSFRMNVMSVQNPDDDFAEGPALSFERKSAPAPQPAKKSYAWLFILILAVIVVGGGVTAFVILKNKKPATPAKISVPKVIGLSIVEADQKLRLVGLEPAEMFTEAPTTDSKQQFRIKDQLPLPDSLVDPTTRVALTVFITQAPAPASPTPAPPIRTTPVPPVRVGPNIVLRPTRDALIMMQTNRITPGSGR